MSSTFIISYDLPKPGANYEALYDAIKEYSETHWHCLDSTWIIISSYSASAIRDHLSKKLDNNDKLLVIKSGDVGAWTGFNNECSQWLKNNL